MTPFKSTLLAITLFLLPCVSNAQIINFCPTNIDFEQGNFFNWLCYTGTCCPINVNPNPVAPIANRHVITNGPATDYYGGFPIVAPGGNQYSLKLGNNSVNYEVDRARYYVQVPAGLNNYSLIYRYAVVFENPGHPYSDQPSFHVKGFDSATMTPIPCATYTYVASGTNNGFSLSPYGSQVWYKGWTTASLNLSGWGGHTVLLEFTASDCGYGGHFGYGYVDMNCGLFQVSGNACGLSTTTLSAPYGFDTYTWWNDNYTSTVGTGQIVTINTPPVTTTYHVVIQPQPGFGCPDTLTTVVNVTDMVFGPNSNDTTVCPGANVPLFCQASGTTGPFTYSWFPTTGLSNPNIQNPIALGVQNTITYYASATDTNGCIKLDTITITVNNFTGVQMNVTNVPCYGGTGSITAVPQGGQGPYTYQWLPTGGNGSTASSLTPGTYTVTVTDAMGCVRTATANVTQPPNMNLQMSGNSVNCFGQTNGQASVVVTGGTPGYTYQWLPTGGTGSTANGLTGGTYTVNVTDANGCLKVGTVTIASPTQLTATMTNVVNINCFGQNTGCATVNVSGGTPPYTYFWSSTPPQYTATACNLYAGNYTCQVTDANGCVTSATVAITQPPQLTATITQTQATICNGSNGSATVTAGGGTSPYTYLWSNGQTNAQATGLAPGLYTVTVTDNKGCTATAQVQIASSSQMNLVMSSTNAGCNGQSNGTASVVVSGGTSPYTYQWSPSGGTGATTTPITAGSYIVTVTDAQGCVAFGNVTVGQPPAVVATISNIVNVNCNGLSSGSAIASATGGSGTGYTYQWSNGQTTAIATSLAAGTYTVTVTDNQGCYDTAQVTIQQPPAVVATVTSSSNATCSQNNGTITVTGSGGVPPYTYQWSNSATTPTISSLPPGSYTCNVKDANNCVATVTVNIQGTTSLTVTTTQADVSCFGLADGWAVGEVVVGVPPYTWSWTNTTSNSDSATGLAAGQYVVNVIDNTGCPGTATVTITEPSAPLAAQISGVADVKCYGGQDGTAMANANGGTTPYTYLWNPIGSNVQNPTNLTAGTYKMIVTDDHGCQDSADVTINEPTDIVFSAQATGSSCEGMNQGSAEATVSGGTTPYTVTWGTTPAQTGLTASGMNPGNYTVLVTDANGCQKSTNVTVGGFPSPVVDAGPDKIYCYGQAGVQLNATGADSYQWTPASGLTCTDCFNPVASPNGTTTYVVTGTDANNCQGTDQVVVTVYTEQPTSVGQDKDICVGDVAQLTATGGESYIWTPSDGLNNHTIYNPVATPTSTTVYQVVIIENACFSDTLNQEIRVHQRPTVDLGPDRKELSGSTIIIVADTANADNITWTPPTNLSCYDCDKPTVAVEVTASYVVTVSNPGCSATDDININVTCEKNDLFIANTFTPNNDGNNDRFYPQTPGINKMKSMMVFDRWGEKVFEAVNFPANNPSYGWDGSYKGVPLAPDTYVYFMEYICGDGTKITLKGDISIVR